MHMATAEAAEPPHATATHISTTCMCAMHSGNSRCSSHPHAASPLLRNQRVCSACAGGPGPRTTAQTTGRPAPAGGRLCCPRLQTPRRDRWNRQRRRAQSRNGRGGRDPLRRRHRRRTGRVQHALDPLVRSLIYTRTHRPLPMRRSRRCTHARCMPGACIRRGRAFRCTGARRCCPPRWQPRRFGNIAALHPTPHTHMPPIMSRGCCDERSFGTAGTVRRASTAQMPTIPHPWCSGQRRGSLRRHRSHGAVRLVQLRML